MVSLASGNRRAHYFANAPGYVFSAKGAIHL